jgi:hypothetical protein
MSEIVHIQLQSEGLVGGTQDLQSPRLEEDNWQLWGDDIVQYVKVPLT